MCYKLMECSSLTRNKTTKDHLCHILSIMIKKYNHSYGACVMIVQTLPHYEHLSGVYADLILTCVKQLGYEPILPALMRELRHHIKTLELKTTSNKENPVVKFYAQFLMDIGERLPTHMIHEISLIMDYLDDESYLLRNSVLFIIGEIIVKVLSEESINNDLNLKKTRNELLDTLCEHIYDSNAITRSKALQIWRKICGEKKLPLQYQNEIMRRCVGRMEDVASSVRKSAFQLLCDMINNNPYGIRSIEVSMDEIEAEYKKEAQILSELKAKKNNQTEDKTPEEAVEEEETNSDEDQSNDRLLEQILVQTTKVTYLKDTLVFIKQIETVIPKLTQLLFSKTQTDVIEVITFFVTCYEHGLVDMLFGIRRMLTLLLNSEKTVREAVVDAYRRLYLDKNVLRQDPIKAVKQLIKLTYNISICEYEALEMLIGELCESGEIDSNLIQIMWQFFAQKSSTIAITTEQSTGALILLSMIIKKLPSKGKANIDTLLEYGMNVNESNLFKVKQACLALSNICSQANTKEFDLNEPFKIDNTHKIIENLSEIIVKNFVNFETIDWIPMCESALSCIYKLANNPVNISDTLIFRLIDHLKPISRFFKVVAAEDVIENGEDNQVTSDEDSSCSALLLTRFTSFFGFVAMKMLVFLNTSVVCELKRRKALKEERDKTKKNSKNANKSRRRSKARKSIASRSAGNAGELDLEEEMGLQGAEAEDAELVLVEYILDSKVAVNSLLIKLSQFAICVIKEPAKYPNEQLQLASVMSLMKIMCLSRKICISNLQLIFTVMEKFESELVRSQLILGIGDLIYRFPNELDPWTPHLYSPLRDRSKLVRTNTIRLLSHLILKEQIKTKGQLFEIAICTIDDDSKIATLSKLFFQEYSKRNNGLAIYNILPDIISNLTNCADKDRVNTQQTQTQAMQPRSNVEANISEESFRQIISYLFSFIKKDKQCETLIEKLAHNFKHANTERKCRDLAFCLTKVNINDSGIKKLHDTYKYYEDKLCTESVCELFRQIIKNAKKILMLKVETKKLIEDYEKKIEETLKKGLNNEDGDVGGTQATSASNVTVMQATGKRGAAANKKKTQATRNNRKKKASSSEEEETESDSEIRTVKKGTAANKKGTQVTRNNKKKPMSSSEEEVEDDSESVVNANRNAVANKKGTQVKRNNRKIPTFQSSSSSEESD